jgi:uncharacterized membrane protein
MTARQEGLILIGVLLIGSLIVQVQLKLFANEIGPIIARGGLRFEEKATLLLQATFAWRPLLVGVLGACLVAIWLLALTRMELSVALPLASIALVVNAILGGLLLGETMSVLRMAGIITVAAGLALVLNT